MQSIKIKHNWEYVILTVMFIFCSGSYIGIQYARYFDTIYLLSCLVVFLTKRLTLNKINIFLYILMSVLLLTNYAFHVHENPGMNGYISLFFRLTGTLLLCSLLDIDRFMHTFCRLITIICALSFCIFLGYTLFQVIKPTTVQMNYVNIGIFRIADNKYFQTRNAGIFWEPGAYQIFINLAAFFLLKQYNFKISTQIKKTDGVCLGILLVTMISTYSTIGYIMMAFLVLYVLYRSIQALKRLNKILIGVPIIAVTAFLLIYALQSETIMGKITGVTTGSMALRTNDLIHTFKLIADNPITGLGFETEKMFAAFSSVNIQNNSTGFLYYTSCFGILFFIIYIVRIYAFTKNSFKNQKWLLFIIVILSGFTEGFCVYPIYLIFLFQFKTTGMERLESEELCVS